MYISEVNTRLCFHILFLVSVTCIKCGFSHAQAPDLAFERFGTEDGLSQAATTCLLQDRQGFLWVGTQNGLNRYDGYEFQQFFHDPQDTNSLSNSHIKSLYQDRDGLIWVGTFKGLSAYNPDTENWYRFHSVEEDSTTLSHFDVFCSYEDQSGEFWIGTGIGLNRLIREGEDPHTWTIERNPIHKRIGTPLPHQTIHQIVEDEQHNLWLTVGRGGNGGRTGKGAIIRWDKTRADVAHYVYAPQEVKSNPEGEVTEIFLDASQRIWVGTIYEGLQRYLPEKNEFRNYPIGLPDGLPHRLLKSFGEDKKGNVWIGTYQGLACLPSGRGETFRSYGYDPNSTEEPFLGSITDILEDHSGNLWIASDIGLFKANDRVHGFTNYTFKPNDPNSLIGNDIFGILPHSNGNIWVSSYRTGLTRIIPQADGSEKMVRYYPQKNIPNGLQASSLIALEEGPNQHIWIGSFEGVIEVIPGASPQSPVKMNTYLHDQNDPQTLGSNYVYQALPDEKGGVWLTDYTVGLEYMKRENGKLLFRRFQPDQNDPFSIPSARPIRVFQDPHEMIWVTTHGLSRLYLNENKEGKFRHLFADPMDYRKEEHVKINAIHWVDATLMWIASDQGLWRVQLTGDVDVSPWESKVSPMLDADLRHYSEKQGFLPGPMVGILPDDHGRLWISTQYGISRFDPQSGEIRHYDKNDGLIGSEMNGLGYAKNSKGELFFGGVDGMVRFHPDSLKINETIPPVYLTEIRLFNEVLEVGKPIPQSEFVLSSSPATLEEMRLSFKDYVVSFEFAALDFTKPQKNQYAYKMDGLDDAWIEAGTRRFVTYTNLAPGNYTFRVKASNNDLLWNEEGLALKITVDPPWWQRWWAYVMYIAALALGIYGIVRMRTRAVRQEMRTLARVEQAKVEEREQVRAQSSRDFHDEAGNHITKISLYTGLVKRGLGEKNEMENYLDRIEENLGALSGGMRDFIWVLDPQKDGLDQIIQRLIDFGHELYEDSGVEFIANNQLALDQVLRLDVSAKRNLLLIFKEGMNNALKYAQASTVRFSVSCEEDLLQVELADDGLGFDKEKLVRVNGLNNMKKRAEEMGANLQVDAIPGVGARILIQKQIHPNG